MDHTDSRFLAQTALGSGILFSYPQISTIAGVQGLVVYSLSSALPILVFAWLGPIIRRKCPEGFVLTEWTRQRYGAITSLYLSALKYSQALFFFNQPSNLLQAHYTISVHGCRALRSPADYQCSH